MQYVYGKKENGLDFNIDKHWITSKKNTAERNAAAQFFKDCKDPDSI